MGRLSGRGLPTRLGSQKSRFGGGGQSESERDRRRYREQGWRKWYATARWRKLKAAVLKRDGYQCQRTGVLLVGKAPADNSPVVHHKEPHRGAPELFWDIDNLEAVSKKWHDSEGQREDIKHDGRL